MMMEYTFAFDTTKIKELESALYNRGFLCMDKEAGVKVKALTNQGKNGRTKSILFRSRARIDCALQRIKDILDHLNTMKIGDNHHFEQAYDFYEFLIYECIVIDCIEALAKIFNVEQDLNNLKSQQDIFHKNGSDWDYVKYIRSLCVIHPLETALHPSYNGYENFHCCKAVRWDSALQDGNDLTAVIYDSGCSGTEFSFIRLKVSQFEDFLKHCIGFLDKVINAVKNYEITGVEQYRKQIIRKPEEYASYSEYIMALSKEYGKRGYYNQENCFNDFIMIFNTEITEKDNKPKVELYRNAIKYALSYLHQRLQNMDEGKGKTTGIQYDYSYNYTELFIEVHRPDNLGSKGYDVRDGIKEYLDTSYPFFLIPEDGMVAFDRWISEYVIFKGTESYSEKYVLIMTALYLDSLKRNCTLNWNIPNDVIYREKVMPDEEYEKMIEGIF